MSTFLGGSEISEMYIGQNKVREVYAGSELVYQSKSPVPFRYVNAIPGFGTFYTDQGDNYLQFNVIKGTEPVDMDLVYVRTPRDGRTKYRRGFHSSILIQLDLGRVYDNIESFTLGSTSQNQSITISTETYNSGVYYTITAEEGDIYNVPNV